MPFLQALGALVAFLTVSLTLVAGVQLAAAYRAVLRPAEVGFGYLKLGADEFRQIVLLLVFSVIYLLLWGLPFALAVAAHAVGDLDTPAAVALYLLAGVVALALSIWIGVRLSLAPPMTLATGRLQLGRSWALTRGRFGGLLGMYALTIVFAIMLSVVTEAACDLIAAGAGLTALSLHEPEAFDFAAWSGVMLVGATTYVVVYVASQAILLAVFYVPQATAYAEILADGEPVAADKIEEGGPRP